MRYLIIVIYTLFLTAFTNPYKNIEYFKLKNGLEVFLLDDNKSQNFSIVMDVNVGYGAENRENYGISHLTEHLIFRDKRVPFRDYLDLFKKEGATDVNGITRRYKTTYYVTISPKKSEWIVKEFAKMFFDKKWDREDLENEKKALQIEIGEPIAIEKFFYNLKKFFKKITPKEKNFFNEEFSIKDEPPLLPFYIAQENNKKFTLEDIKDWYKRFYYPSNMRLKIVGNFDKEKIKKIIKESFNKYSDRKGDSIKEPFYKGKLNGKNYISSNIVMRNYAQIGAKYLIDNYKKYLSVQIYLEYMAQKIQRNLRNKEGRSYSVFNSSFSKYNAAVGALAFDGDHKNFRKNIELVKNVLYNNSKTFSLKDANESLKEYEKYFRSISHDVQSLLNLIDDIEYLRDHNETNTDPYRLFKEINGSFLKSEIEKVFNDKNRYIVILYDYLLFPYDILLFFLIAIVIAIFINNKISNRALRKGKKVYYAYHKGDLLIHFRIYPRFVTIINFILITIFSLIIWGWVDYFIGKIIRSFNSYLFESIYINYLISMLDFIAYLLFYIFLVKVFIRYFSRVDITKDTLYIIGRRVLAFPKSSISDIKVVSKKECKKIYGFRFRKDGFIKVELKNKEEFCLSAPHATRRAEILREWLKSS
ncbi:MAG: insulinase family protein [Epsilonproteobacteria bacterium]|nr:insulinase family protein [Campylobacterota bacterium]